MRFDELIERYQIKTDKDKVRHNTLDDFGLGPGWYFLGGDLVGEPPVFTSAWGKVREGPALEEIRRCMSTGLGSFDFHRWEDGKVRGFAQDRRFIGTCPLGVIEDIPALLVPLIVS